MVVFEGREGEKHRKGKEGCFVCASGQEQATTERRVGCRYRPTLKQLHPTCHPITVARTPTGGACHRPSDTIPGQPFVSDSRTASIPFIHPSTANVVLLARLGLRAIITRATVQCSSRCQLRRPLEHHSWAPVIASCLAVEPLLALASTHSLERRRHRPPTILAGAT